MSNSEKSNTQDDTYRNWRKIGISLLLILILLLLVGVFLQPNPGPSPNPDPEPNPDPTPTPTEYNTTITETPTNNTTDSSETNNTTPNDTITETPEDDDTSDTLTPTPTPTPTNNTTDSSDNNTTTETNNALGVTFNPFPDSSSSEYKHLEDASVYLLDTSGNVIEQTKTNQTGQYSFTQPVKDEYRIAVSVVEKDGFKPFYAGAVQNTSSIVNFTFTNKNTVVINGTESDVSYDITQKNSREKPIVNIYQLQGIQSDKSASYKLVKDVDGSNTENWEATEGQYYDKTTNGFLPIGEYGYEFTGEIYGNNHTINNIYINNSEDSVGVIGYNAGNISNLQVTDVSIQGNTDVGVIGNNDNGNITNVYTSGSITGQSDVGGLVGESGGYYDVKISKSSSSATVTGSQNIGGLVGSGGDTLIIKSYATGTVKNNDSSPIGGLVGRTTGIVKNSYATGTVSSSSESQVNIGGLVGMNQGEIYTSYATGTVSSADEEKAHIGGLVGWERGGTTTNTYWDISSTTQQEPIGYTGNPDSYNSTTNVHGLTTSEMQGTNAQTNMNEFNWNTVWQTTNKYPILQWDE